MQTQTASVQPIGPSEPTLYSKEYHAELIYRERVRKAAAAIKASATHLAQTLSDVQQNALAKAHNDVLEAQRMYDTAKADRTRVVRTMFN